LSSCIQLIAGLANLGKEYVDTRHNAGAWLIENILEFTHTTLHREIKFHGLYGQAKFDHRACHLLIPTTFMNLSGQSVRACMAYHKLTPANILIAHDDVDLPVGTIKLKLDGGDGGHNGLKDIIRHLNTKQFYRLRIGVGRPTHGDVADYVLEKPSKADKQKIEQALQSAIDVLPMIVAGDIQKAMMTLHTAS